MDGFLAEVKNFAGTDFLAALYAGGTLTTAQRDEMATRLHDYLGLPRETFLRNDLRVDIRKFADELLAHEQRRLSVYDARYTFPASSGPLDAVGDDPSMTQIGPAMISGLLSYIRSDLAVQIDSRYEPISWIVSHQWKYLDTRPNQAEDLARAMRQNPDMKLFVAAGQYDLMTSMGGAEYALSHGGVPMDRVTLAQYASGHMPYIGEQNLQKLSKDLRAFIRPTAR